jgi:O-antigen/teichoic acid export membrane protein
VISLSFIRLIIWLFFLLGCFRVNNKIKREFKFDITLIKPILKLSGWITVANIIGPLILYSDRVLIGGLVSATAITYYATPYEVVTKFLLIPGALVGVLFPVFSASYPTDPDFSKKLFVKGTKFIFLFLYPIVFLSVTFSYEGLELWLGQKFAESSSLILQLLSIGVLLNGIAYIPFHFFQGTGKPEIPAKVNLIELPFYLLLMWFFILKMGIIGAAFVWLFRIIVDSLILFLIAGKTIQTIYKSKFTLLFFIIMISFLILPIIISDITVKIFFAVSIILSFLIVSWKFFLSAEEKIFLVSKFKILRISAL